MTDAPAPAKVYRIEPDEWGIQMLDAITSVGVEAVFAYMQKPLLRAILLTDPSFLISLAEYRNIVEMQAKAGASPEDSWTRLHEQLSKVSDQARKDTGRGVT